jgi:serine/threonine protein kinase
MAVSFPVSGYGSSSRVVEVGQVIDGKYKLLRLLGDGGMGSVYEAEHLGLGVRVAMKVLHAELSRKAGLNERFVQEARVSAQIKSAHVVHVTDVDRTPEGVAYLVMELLQGEPLSNVMRREKKLSVGTAAEYTNQILQALEAAHALGVIHRDLKPDNVFLTFQGGKPVLKLIDFGIAKLKRDGQGATKNLTVAGMLMGTPEYMAPEQAYSADKVDVRADLYAVGCMMYEMLCGHTPASGEDPRVVVLKVERGEVPPLVQEAPGVPAPIAGFVHRAMAPRPELRFATATEMRVELEAIIAGKPRTAQIPRATGMQPQASITPAVPGIDPKTGTIAGAPIEGALTPNVKVGSNPPPPDVHTQAPGTGTVRGAPIHMPQPMPVVAQPSYEPSRTPQKRGGRGLIVALALIALLLGASAVVLYVLGTDGWGKESTPPQQSLTTTTATPTTPTTPGVPPTVVTVAPPLTPVPNTVQPPHTAPHPSGSAAPRPSGSTAPSSGPPPFVIPSINIPPFPSTLPSGFPPFPSGFPTLFPPPQQPPPQKDPAKDQPPAPHTEQDQPQPQPHTQAPDPKPTPANRPRLKYPRRHG